jgi:putative ATP-dependent endonuclease of OLD family
MKLKTFEIENFRGITKLVLDLDSTTVLIGENNAGKTSVLEALHTCMNRGLSRRGVPFAEYDFHLASDDAQPQESPPLTLTLVFEEEKTDEWPVEVDQAFSKAVNILADDRKQLIFRVQAKYDKAVKDYTVEWAFLNEKRAALVSARQPKLVTDLQSLAPVFLLGAVRDHQHFSARSPFWSPFTKNADIDDETRKKIEEEIGTLNQTILDNHKPFDVVKKAIAKTGTLLQLADKELVSVEAIPARVFDMLSRTQMKLGCRTGARLPIGQHGAGTQSLSVLFLFEAFLQSQLTSSYDKQSVPILALEEPEAHLHPSAVRALWTTIDQLAGQKIVATHSGELVSAVPLRAIRRLARKGGKIEVFSIPDGLLTADEARKVSYHVRAKRGSLMFAKSWLLVEGESEFWFMPEAALAVKEDFELAGVSCVEFAQCGLKPLIKMAKALGIEWHVMTDADNAGLEYARIARAQMGGEPEATRITILPKQDLEHTLWHHGYANVYTAIGSTTPAPQPQAAKKCKNGDPCSHMKPPAVLPVETVMIKRAISASSKPQMAIAVVEAVRKAGSVGLPAAISAAIKAAVKNGQS